MGMNEWRSKKLFWANDNEKNELQKKRDNWVYIKNYNNDGKLVSAIFRCAIFLDLWPTLFLQYINIWLDIIVFNHIIICNFFCSKICHNNISQNLTKTFYKKSFHESMYLEKLRITASVKLFIKMLLSLWCILYCKCTSQVSCCCRHYLKFELLVIIKLGG